ncbi:MAG: extracellular solute-binding protein [Caldilineaceae bacterium]
MYSQNGRFLGKTTTLVTCICMLLLIGCSGNGALTEDALTSPASIATAETSVQPSVNNETPATRVTDRQLVIWAPDLFQASLDPTTNHPMVALFEEFERNHPGVHIDVQIRADGGEAGILDYLRSAQRVAPAILPDIMLVNTQQLWQVVELGLLAPIDLAQLDSATEFYPHALLAATYNEQLWGIPYVTDLVHAVYYTAESATAPSTWEALLGAQQPYLFAAGKSEDVNLFAYQQYLGAGGNPDIGIGTDEMALSSFFAFLAQAKADGIIPDEVLEVTDADDVWQLFAAADQGIAEISTHVAIQHLELFNNGMIQFVHSPTRTDNNETLAHVWAFAIVAGDVEQQALSLALVKAFFNPMPIARGVKQ